MPSVAETDSPNPHDGDKNDTKSPTFDRHMSIEVKDQVGAMSISPSGRDIVLASRRGLLVLDLDNPYDPPRFLHHLTPWEVADVQWNVHKFKDEWVVSTSNQKAMVWNLSMPSKRAIEFVLHGHTRAITDMNWSAFNPHILSTCSIDSFVHTWDLRDPGHPSNSFSDWYAGATQVKWNRQNEHIIASSHGRNIRVWDDRFGARPITSICTSSSMTKVYGIDFNRTRESGILSCGLDCSVKFWDYNKDCTNPERELRTPYPVWRARHTPFGWGVMVMPQRGDNSLHMYDRRAQGITESDPVLSFRGHTDQAKEFLWRSQGSSDVADNRMFQLVTWSKDQHVRLWPLDKSNMEAVGHDSSKPVRFRMTRKGATYRTFHHEPTTQREVGQANVSMALAQVSTSSRGLLLARSNMARNEKPGGFMTKGPSKGREMSAIGWMKGVRMNRSSTSNSASWTAPENLGEELASVGQRFPKVSFEQINVAERSCAIALNSPRGENGSLIFLRLKVNFSPKYPQFQSPEFQLGDGDVTSDDKLYEKIHHNIDRIASTFLQRRLPCLEACLRYLQGEDNFNAKGEWIIQDDSFSIETDEADEYDDGEMIISHAFNDDDDELDPYSSKDRPVATDSLKNQNVPLPKRCAAIWCGNGSLVCIFPAKQERPPLPIAAPQKFGNAGPKRKLPTFGYLEDVDSDSASSESEEISSERESSIGDASTESNEFLAPTRPTLHAMFSLSKKSADSSISTKRFNTPKPDIALTTVSVYEYRDIIPCQYSLAREYKITGPDPKTCEYNAQVARKYGFDTQAETWQILECILSQRMPRSLQEYQSRSASFQKSLSAGPHSHSLKYLTIAAVARSTWGFSPLGRWLIEEIMSYYESVFDIQMLAMMSCVLYEEPDPVSQVQSFLDAENEFLRNAKIENKAPNEPMVPSLLSLMDDYTVTPSQVYLSQEHNSSDGRASEADFMTTRSNSPSISPTLTPRSNSSLALTSSKVNLLDVDRRFNFSSTISKSPDSDKSLLMPSNVRRLPHTSRKTGRPGFVAKVVNRELYDDDESVPVAMPMLDVSKTERYSTYREAYADMLYRYQLFNQRCDILKFNLTSLKDEPGGELDESKASIRATCQNCGKNVDGKNCKSCGYKIAPFKCIICDLSVRGPVSSCTRCLHGGHTQCISDWFGAGNTICAEICDCACVEPRSENGVMG